MEMYGINVAWYLLGALGVFVAVMVVRANKNKGTGGDLGGTGGSTKKQK